MAYQLGGGIKSVRRLYADSAKCEPWPGKGFLRFSGICSFGPHEYSRNGVSGAHIHEPLSGGVGAACGENLRRFAPALRADRRNSPLLWASKSFIYGAPGPNAVYTYKRKG